MLFVPSGMLGLARFLERGGIPWLLVGGAGLAGLALTRVAYGWVLTVALLVLAVWWLAARSRWAGRAAAVVHCRSRCVFRGSHTHAKTDRLFVWETPAASRSTG